MSWIQKLYETYENCQTEIGKIPENNLIPLLPICHTTQKAQISIVLDSAGNYLDAQIVPKSNSRTIIPATEESSGRTSGPRAHPLCDKLQYIAKDYKKYGGKKDAQYESFISQLEDWSNSQFALPQLRTILAYVKAGDVIGKLIKQQVLFVDSTGILLEKWNKSLGGVIPEIFTVLTSQEEAFVRWIIRDAGQPDNEVWNNKAIWQSWINYYTNQKQTQSLCYVTGKINFSADQHPAKIRNDGDKAKIISANDSSGFTYRGRFVTPLDVAAVSFEVTQKAHSALRWLISRQGYCRGDLAIVAWATTGEDVPKPTDDPLSVLDIEDIPSSSPRLTWTAQNIAIELRSRIAGYSTKLGKSTNVVVISLDSATPGRMSIAFYRELSGSDFLNRIQTWHEDCAWVHSYRLINTIDLKSGKKKQIHMPFIGAPSPSDIAEAVYGKRLDDKLRKNTIARILPCIIDGQPLPRDLVVSAVRRASNRNSMDYWEWNKTLTIACALFRKYNRKEKYAMSLDPNRKTRDYLYGRLLALAESLEEWALSSAGENRETTAARLMQRFAEHPFTTWRTIELSLAPYKARLGAQSSKRQRMIDEVVASFTDGEFISDKPLSGEFLLGYHCQREMLRSPVKKIEGNEN